MHKNETQQFAKFFLKDLKSKKQDQNKKKSHIENLNVSSSS